MMEEVERIIRESGKRVAASRNFTVRNKGSAENVVTSVDVENEQFLRSKLLSLIPDSVFIGEEGDSASLSDAEWVWIVDPIDGTMNFTRKIPFCAVSVALFRNGRPHAGYALNPFTDTLYSAVSGHGAYRDGERIHVSDRPIEECLMSTAWCCYGKQLSAPCFRVSERMFPRINDIRRIGSAAVELSMLAEGAIDLYFEIRLSPWDYAAGLVILTEAGGCCTGIGCDVAYDKQSPVLAANSPRNLAILSDIVAEEFGEKTPYRRQFFSNPPGYDG